MKDRERQAINNLNNLLQNRPAYNDFTQQIKSNVDILSQGLYDLDQEVKQKTFEVKNREQLLAQKDQILVQKEQKVGELQTTVFADSLHKLYPDSYSAKVEEWPDTLPMKKHVVNNNVYVMEKNTAIYKPLIEKKEKETIKKEFVKSLNELDPYNYTTDPTTWFYKDGRGPLPMKVHYDNNNYEVMVKNTKTYKKEIEEIKAKKLEEAKKLKEETIQKEQLLAQKDQLLSNKDNILNEKDQAIEALKLLIAQKELEKQELLSQTENISTVKDQLLADKDREMQSLREELVQKDREREELLEQQEKEREELRVEKDLELANKSLVKNQVIGELKEDIGLKEKEAYKLQIELLTKQLEAAREIGKQKEINTELVEQNEILGLKMQYYDMEVKNKEAEKEIFLTQKQKLSFLVSQKEQEFQNLLIQKEIEQKELLLAKELAVTDKSFEKNQVIEQLREEIEGLNKQLLDNQPIYRSIYIEDRSCQPGESLVERQMASLDLSSINLSPINHGEQNQIVGNIIGNFDINNVHTTNSVLISGEVSQSFEIVDTENFH